MVNTPKFLALVLRGVFGSFRDDNFTPISNWTDVSGTGTKSTDGDILTQISTVASTYIIRRAVPGSLSTDTFTKLVHRRRFTAGNPLTLNVKVNYTVGSDTFGLGFPNTWTTTEHALTAGKVISSIDLELTSTTPQNTATMKWDFFVFCKSSFLDLSSKMRGYEFDDVLGWQVGECSVELQDEDGFFWKTTNILNPADIFMLYESFDFDSDNVYRAWGGPIRDLDKTSEAGNRVLTLRAHNWNKALESTVVFKFYGEQTDASIVTDLIDTINTGFVVPTVSGWSLAKDITGYTTVNMALNAIQGQEVVKLLTDVSNYTAIQVGGNGTDFWVTPAELFRYKQILDAAWGATATLSDTPPSNDFISLNLNNHMFDLRNIVTVIGVLAAPARPDDWTEPATPNGWTLEASTTLARSSAGPPGPAYGTFKYVITRTAGAGTGQIGIFRDLLGAWNISKMQSIAGGTFKKPALSFWYAMAANTLAVILETSANNFFQATFGVALDGKQVELTLGESESGISGPWVKTGSPTWSNITRIYFRRASAGEGFGFDLDGVQLIGTAAETAVDARTGKGEAQFGRRDVVLFDPTPRESSIATSTAGGPGARQIAKMELFKWADPITSGYIDFDATSVNAATVLGTIKPGAKIPITSAHYNFTAKNFRVLRIRHRWRKGDDYISVAAEITDFMTNTLSRQPGDLFRELMPFDAVSRGSYEQMKFQGLLAYGGLTLTKFKYTSLSDPGIEI